MIHYGYEFMNLYKNLLILATVLLVIQIFVSFPQLIFFRRLIGFNIW